jgi:type II secretory pathway pseudopilin PulG
MQAVEVVAVLGIAAVLATAGYRAANERRDAGRLAAELSAVAAVAAAYQGAGANCGRPSGTVLSVESMIATLGNGPAGPAEPAAWGVRYYSRPSSTRSSWPPMGSPAAGLRTSSRQPCRHSAPKPKATRRKEFFTE